MWDSYTDSPTPADLAAVEAELPEWDRLRVRDYWDAVVAAELGAPQSPSSPYAQGRAGTRRAHTDGRGATLRLIPGAATEALGRTTFPSSEAA